MWRRAAELPVVVDDVTVGSVACRSATGRIALCRREAGPGLKMCLAKPTPWQVSPEPRRWVRYVELAPPTDRPPTGRLVDGSRITEPAPTDSPPPRRFLGAGVVVNTRVTSVRWKRSLARDPQAVAGRQFVNLVPRLAELTAGLNRLGSTSSMRWMG